MPLKVGLQYIDIWKESMEDEVREYEKEPVKKGQIVFYGPSYFTRWSKKWGMRPLREDLLGKSGEQCCINRGFGSSCSEHQLYYYPRMIRPLEPSVLVYKSYANADAFGYTAEETWELAQRVIAYTLTDFPHCRIYLCSATRLRNMSDEGIERARLYNSWVKEFAEKTPNCYYIDCFEYEPLIRDDIYVDDGVHYNQSGYDIFAELFREELKDELDKF